MKNYWVAVYSEPGHVNDIFTRNVQYDSWLSNPGAQLGDALLIYIGSKGTTGKDLSDPRAKAKLKEMGPGFWAIATAQSDAGEDPELVPGWRRPTNGVWKPKGKCWVRLGGHPTELALLEEPVTQRDLEDDWLLRDWAFAKVAMKNKSIKVSLQQGRRLAELILEKPLNAALQGDRNFRAIVGL